MRQQTPTNIWAWPQVISCDSTQALCMPLGQIESRILLIIAVLYLWLTYSPCIQCLLHDCRLALYFTIGQFKIQYTATPLQHILRCRVSSGREHALNKQYALNSGVRLITKVYGIYSNMHCSFFHTVLLVQARQVPTFTQMIVSSYHHVTVHSVFMKRCSNSCRMC